jgi:carbonic anhydrase
MPPAPAARPGADGFAFVPPRSVGRRPAPESFTDLDADVRQSVGRIRDDPFIPVKDSVRGFVYDVETGTLREVE